MEKAVGNNLLKLLKEREGTFVSGEAMSKALGITRAGIWKRIKAMKQKGYVINSSPSKGYKLLRSPDILTADEITGVFQGKLLGKKVLFFESTTSTNDIAMEMGQKGSPEGTIVVADAQEKGKGRLGRTWISPPGVNLYFTLLLRPPFPPKDATLLTLMAAVSIVSAIRKYTGLKATIKWPNDILIGDKKVGGVLTEMKSDMDRISFVALGMGINVNLDLNTLPEDVRIIATSLKHEARESISRVEFLGRILRELEHWYSVLLKVGRRPLLDEWRTLTSTLGKRVKVSMAKRIISGIAENIDDDGELIVKLPSGRIEKVCAGDVTILKNSKSKEQ